MQSDYSSKMKEALRITEYADREAKSILSEIDMQNEKLVEIQKMSGESLGLLSLNNQLIEKTRKGMSAKLLIAVLLFLLIVLVLVFVKISLY
eukprot:jgi/Antlo1/1534/1805